jgi:hypothetical protein
MDVHEYVRVLVIPEGPCRFYLLPSNSLFPNRTDKLPLIPKRNLLSRIHVETPPEALWASHVKNLLSHCAGHNFRRNLAVNRVSQKPKELKETRFPGTVRPHHNHEWIKLSDEIAEGPVPSQPNGLQSMSHLKTTGSTRKLLLPACKLTKKLEKRKRSVRR